MLLLEALAARMPAAQELFAKFVRLWHVRVYVKARRYGERNGRWGNMKSVKLRERARQAPSMRRNRTAKVSGEKVGGVFRTWKPAEGAMR